MHLKTHINIDAGRVQLAQNDGNLDTNHPKLRGNTSFWHCQIDQAPTEAAIMSITQDLSSILIEMIF